MLTSWLALFFLQSQVAAVPVHLQLARDFASVIQPQDTGYRHKNEEVVWPGTGAVSKCFTDCSGFWNALIPRAYPSVTTERIEAWTGRARPRAEDWFAVMQDGKGFQIRKKVGEIRAGDFVAIRYERGAENTGHTLLVDLQPQPIPGNAPMIDATSQYSVRVIDVTSTPHGAGDSRGKAAGLGVGVIRFYANADGTLAGHCWSLSGKSQFRPISLRPIVVGGLDPSGIPKIEAQNYRRSFASSRRISR